MSEEWARGKEAAEESLRMPLAGQARQAFDLVDAALREAIQEDRRTWALSLTKHGVVLARAASDRTREIVYSEQALRFTTKDYAFAAYNFAKLLAIDGDNARGEQFASEAYALASSGSTEADADLVAAIRKQWPNLGQNNSKSM